MFSVSALNNSETRQISEIGLFSAQYISDNLNRVAKNALKNTTQCAENNKKLFFQKQS